MSNSPYNSSEPPASAGTAHTQAEIAARNTALAVIGFSGSPDWIKDGEPRPRAVEYLTEIIGREISTALAESEARCAALREALEDALPILETEAKALKYLWTEEDIHGAAAEAERVFEAARTALRSHPASKS